MVVIQTGREAIIGSGAIVDHRLDQREVEDGNEHWSNDVSAGLDNQPGNAINVWDLYQCNVAIYLNKNMMIVYLFQYAPVT